MLAVEETRAGTEASFRAYGRPLTNVMAFKYLDSILTATDSDWPTVVANLRKARKKWVRVSRILRREGVNARTSGKFQDGPPGSPPLWLRDVGGDPPRQQDAGGLPPQGGRPADGQAALEVSRWRLGVPPLWAAIREAGLEEVETYITRRQNTVAQYIATQPILELCEEAERRPGARVSKRWWEQEGINLAGARVVTAAETEEVDGATGEGWMAEAGG